MPASFPTSVKTFATRNPGNTSASAHINDLQDEVAAIETHLIANGFRHQLVLTVKASPYGAVGDRVPDDTAALQLAIDSGRPLYIPEGTYLVSLGTSITLEGGATVCALKARTGMALQGAGI